MFNGWLSISKKQSSDTDLYVTFGKSIKLTKVLFTIPNAFCTRMIEIYQGGNTTNRIGPIPVRRKCHRILVPEPQNDGTTMVELNTDLICYSLKIRLLSKYENIFSGIGQKVGINYLLCYGKDLGIE